jgi:transposase InsO family protein
MYSIDKHLPRLRRDIALYAKKTGIRAASRHFGYSPSCVSKWVKILETKGLYPIETKSSRPKTHPKALSDDITSQIVGVRIQTKRSAEVVHELLRRRGVFVSVSSVKRTLDSRYLLKKRSPWKRYHKPVHRPHVEKPGDLVEIDTIHTMTGKKSRMYTFVLIDVYSRWIYAKSYEKMNSQTTLDFVKEAQEYAPFYFTMLQSDHGPEFGKWFVSRCGYLHRYTRLGKPNDNAHVERVNRTVQEECLDKHRNTPGAFNKALQEYVPYYNNQRLHFGINLKTPNEVLGCSQGID